MKKGEPIISEGKYRLLKEIEKTGSILKASENLGLTYKRAISQIKVMEERLGDRILDRKRGKGARLTETGRDLIRRYEKVLRKVYEAVRSAERDLQT
ncbi:MAG: LysR family transcriptional regulator [Aquificota bacterium]|nr:LysR family transcriptional regulator [Aquificota bacterium]